MTITVREAVAGYARHSRSLGLSPGYIGKQMVYLNRFAISCRGIQVKSLTPDHVARFFETLPETRPSHNKALESLRAFVRYAERMKYLRAGSADFLLGDRKTRKSVRQPKYYIPPSQFGLMLDAAGERHPVDRMTLALALYTLARQGEITGLRLKDLDLAAGTIRIYRAKRKRWTVVQICPELRDELWIWLCKYADQAGWPTSQPVDQMCAGRPDWYLVPGLDCTRVINPVKGGYDSKLTEYRLNPEKQGERLERLVKRLLDIFGAQTGHSKWVRHLGEGMHTIRRSGSRAMLDHLAGVHGEDKALLMVSTMLDHESTVTTLGYIGRSLEQKRLNQYLASGSMYGDHGRAFPEDSNVTRMPLYGSESKSESLRRSEATRIGEGEVDAL